MWERQIKVINIYLRIFACFYDLAHYPQGHKHFKDVVQEEEKELEQKTGIEANIKEEDLKSILEEVLQEVGKTKKPK
jgi:hypothetical protein